MNIERITHEGGVIPIYRVLIAEDEMLVRLGLKNSIQWDKFDMTVVADLPDGQKAWDFYCREKPDLIVTDLKMPGMGGMELIEKIRENDTHTKIIVLSCLDEFSLVHKAMKLDVSDYLLKLTMTKDETEAVLKKIQAELNARSKESPAVASAAADSEKEQAIREILLSAGGTKAAFAEQVQKLKLRLHPENLRVCVMDVSRIDCLKSDQCRNLQSSITNMLNEQMCKFNRGEAICYNNSLYVLLFSFNDLADEHKVFLELHQILSHIRNSMEAYFNAVVAFGISGSKSGYIHVPELYAQAEQALVKKFFFGFGDYFYENADDISEALAQAAGSLRSIAVLDSIFNQNQRAQYAEKIRWLTNFTEEKDTVLAFFSELLQWFASTLYLKGDQAEKLLVFGIRGILQCETLDAAIETFKKSVFDILDMYMNARAFSKEMNEAIHYIRKNFDKDISLTQTAEYAGLAPTYLSNLFKKQMGKSYVDYLNELRVDKARELLRTTRMKAYEIAEKSGFTDETYFCKVFKKIEGVSPNQYRKRIFAKVEGDLNDKTDQP